MKGNVKDPVVEVCQMISKGNWLVSQRVGRHLDGEKIEMPSQRPESAEMGGVFGPWAVRGGSSFSSKQKKFSRNFQFF